MGPLRKFFRSSKEPEKPNDYYLGSSIASTIDALVSSQGLAELIDGDWWVELRKDYGVSLTRMPRGENARAVVRLNDLEQMSHYKRVKTNPIMGNSPLGHMATDQLAMAVLRKMKEQIGSQ
ncbi:MAG: hypothetical protein AAB403_08705 [Planctomycetota bacterium]